MKKYILGAVLAFAILISPTPLYAAGLNASQIQAILTILSAFGADTATIANVSNALNGTSQTIITTATGTTTTAGSTDTVSSTTAPTAYLRFSPASSAAINAPFTITMVGANSPTKYWLKIDGQEKDMGNVSTWTGTPATLGFTAGTSHEFYVKACNSAGVCGNWDGSYYFTVSAPAAYDSPPAVFMTANGSSVSDGGSITATANGSVSLTWWNERATSCALNDVAVPASGSQIFGGLTTSMYYTYTCINSHGSKSLRFYLSVATYNPVPTVSMTANGSPVTNGSTITAANGTLPITWSGTSATAPLACTLNGVSVPTEGSKTLSGLTSSSSNVFNCTNSFGSRSLNFTVTAPAVSTAPAPTAYLRFSPTSSAATDVPFTITIGGANSPVKYWLKIDGQEKDLGTVTTWTGTPAALGFTTAGTHTLYAKSCNSAGTCGAWDGPYFFTVTAPAVSTAPAPTAYLRFSPTSSAATDVPFTITIGGANSPVKYWLKIDGQEKDLGTVTTWTGTPAALGFTTAGTHTLYAKSCNSAGTCGAWDGPYFFTVTAPAVPSAYLRLSDVAPALNTPFTLSLFGSNSPTKYWLKIDGQEKDFGMTTSWTGTPATLGFSSGTSHELYVKACNASGCGAWDGAYFFSVAAPVSATTLSSAAMAGVAAAPVVAGMPSQASEMPATSIQCIDLPFNMHRGYESSSVLSLQTYFMSLGLLNESSGFYGDKTVAAVKNYQKSKSLPQTGMVFDFTRRAIQSDTCK